MEFADHREYQAGDDLRYLDPHLHARLGEHYVRQYEVYQQLPIAIVVDGSRSMDYGTPTKFEVAMGLAATLGFVGLAGGDRVELAVWAKDRLHWSPRFHGVSRASRLFDWLDKQEPGGVGSFGHALHAVVRHLTARGLLILISDWWADNLEADLRTVVAAGQEIWALQVVAPEEAEPARLGEGEVRLIDAENGQEVELALDRPTLDRYGRAMAAWSEQLRDIVTSARGRYRMVRTDQNLERLLLQEWRRAGMIA
jgi:uncharacterized protein (DUF58 family)